MSYAIVRIGGKQYRVREGERLLVDHLPQSAGETFAADLLMVGGDGDADFDGAVADPEVVAEAWRAWREEVAFAERFADDAPGLDLVGKQGHVLREVLVHMIEEYARHNGHADFLRERIDGRVGQ